MIKYKRNDVYKNTLNYFDGNELASNVWIDKYCLKDADGNFYEKSPDDMHKRLAKEFARIESKYLNPLSEKDIYELFKKFKYIVPQGSPMAGIGNNEQIVSLSNCFYLDHLGDSYGSIMDIDEKLTHVFKRRGGCGIDISKLRPRNAKVKNAALSSTGAVSFAERYSNTTREVAAEGRRAALMISMSINHPDIEEFIDAKLEKNKITGANISVKITDDFMESLKNDKYFIQTYPIDIDKNKINTDLLIEENKLYFVGEIDNKKTYAKKIKPKRLWEKIIDNVWKSAEPGLLFWDNFKRESPSDGYEGFELQGVNPCAELSLSDSESCRLMLINLYSYVVNPFSNNSYFDFDLFKKHVKLAQRLIDDLIDLEIEKVDKIIEKIKSDPEPDIIKQKEIMLWEEINRKTIEGRRTGLGITGEGDMLAALGIRYGSKEGLNFSENVHKILAIESYKSSIDMAYERGSFKIWNKEKDFKSDFVKRIYNELDDEYKDKYNKYGRRNIANLTIAPAGSVSILTQTTSGIEPAFKIYYYRRRKTNDKTKSVFIDETGDMWEEYPVFHQKFVEWFEKISIIKFENKKDYLSYLETLSEDKLFEIYKKSPYYKATSEDVDYIGKVELQGAIQKWIDHSISVTVNMPEYVTKDIVSNVYMKGYETGCKGVTVYRDGSRSGVLISKKEDNANIFKNTENNAPKRPKRLKGEIHRFNNNYEKWIAVIGIYDDRPYELFTGKLENGLKDLPNNLKVCEIVKKKIEDEKGNKIKRYDIEYVDSNGEKHIYEGLNFKFNPEFWNYAKLISSVLRHQMPIINVYKLIESLSFREEHINTWKNGVVRTIKKYIKDGEKTKDKCPNCGGDNFVFKEGCLQCMECGWSKCS